MAHYLVVADQTATSPLLLRRAREIAGTDGRAAFTLLVPAPHLQDALLCDEAARREIARERAVQARAAFRRAGLPVLYTEVGDASPLQAIDDELRHRARDYQAIVIATLPPGVSRWLSLDLPARVRHDHRLPVFHVFDGGEDAWASGERLRRMVAIGMRRRPKPARASDERAAFASVREVLPIAALLLLHLVLGVGLAVKYDRTFYMGETFVIVFMTGLVLALWRLGGDADER